VNQRPQETLQQLCELFPSFRAWWEAQEEDPPPEDGLVDGVYYEWTHHSVMSHFLNYFAANHPIFSEKQLHRLGAWIDGAIAAKSDLENAVDTCFLEHPRQVKINRVLAPYLSRKAKGARHA
jgi:hypothetical protein